MKLLGFFRRGRRRAIASAAALSMIGTMLTVPVTLAVLQQPAAAATMPIAFRGASGWSSQSATPTSWTVSKPSGVSANDVLIAHVTAWADAVISPPAGWVLIRADANGTSGFYVEQHLYYRVAGSSEPASYTWTSAVGTHAAVNVTAWDNVSTTAPIEAHSGAVGPDGYVWYDWEPAPSVTPTTNDAMNLLFFGGRTYTDQHNPISTPSGYMQRYTAGTVWVDQAVHSRQLSDTSPTGDQEVTGTGATSAGQQLVLRPENLRPGRATVTAPASGRLFRSGEAQSFGATATDADGDTWRAVFSVYNSGGAFVTSFNGSTTASGLTSTGSPGSPLAGGSYQVSAHAVDAAGNAGAESPRVSFTVESDPGTVGAEPSAQTRNVGQQASITVSVKNASGGPAVSSPVTISRSGANPAGPQTFFTNAAGLYVYSYTGTEAGVDVVNITNGAGSSLTAATVGWNPSIGSVAYPSDACTAANANLVGGYVGTTYLHVRHDADPVDPTVHRVCVAAQDGSLHVGGQLRIRANTAPPVVSVDTTQAAALSCLPIGFRVDEGTVAGGTQYFLDVAPNPNGKLGAWVCAQVGGVFLRIRLATDVPVGVEFRPDTSAPHATYPEPALTGTWSKTCKVPGATRYLNLLVGGEQVLLYSWVEANLKTHVCVRASSVGGRLDVNPGALPTIDATGTQKDASTPWPLFDNGELAVWTVDPLNPTTPAGVFVSVLGIGRRVTVGTGAGTPVAFLQD